MTELQDMIRNRRGKLVPRCQSRTNQGSQCVNIAKPMTGTCYFHETEVFEAMQKRLRKPKKERIEICVLKDIALGRVECPKTAAMEVLAKLNESV